MRRESGHTLIELMIVTLLLGLIFTILGQGSPAMNRSTLTMRDRAHTSSELRLAVDMLLTDLGGAAQLSADGGSLLVVREEEVAIQVGAWSDGNDDGITYWLDDSGNLLRRDAELDTIVVVARELTAFGITQSLTAPGSTAPPPTLGAPGSASPPLPGSDTGDGEPHGAGNTDGAGEGLPGAPLAGDDGLPDVSVDADQEKTPIKGLVTRIQLGAGEGTAARSVDLLWSP